MVAIRLSAAQQPMDRRRAPWSIFVAAGQCHGFARGMAPSTAASPFHGVVTTAPSVWLTARRGTAEEVSNELLGEAWVTLTCAGQLSKLHHPIAGD